MPAIPRALEDVFEDDNRVRLCHDKASTVTAT
ncbi:hypothetical protein J2852_006321 [Azospirillum soli]|nr:hypothetical protein [Azospirillum soli]